MPKEKFTKLVETIISKANLKDEDKEWLEQRLRGNEPTLNTRLKELIRANQNSFIKEYVKIKKVCYPTTISRNYYTHFDKNLENEALRGAELSNLTRKLRGLLISSLFKHLEIENQIFEEKLKFHLS
jgi:integrase